MSASIVGAKLTRQIATSTGLDIVRAWGHGGYRFAFVTSDHRHGTWNKKTGEWQWDETPSHYTSCSELFPGHDGTCRDHDQRWAPIQGGHCIACGRQYPSPPGRDLDESAAATWLAANQPAGNGR